MSDVADLVCIEAARAEEDSTLILIDGRSGAGKTTLARMVAERWSMSSVAQLVALDDLYPGWDGLAAGVDYALKHVIEPYARHETARWRKWDWTRERRGSYSEVEPRELLIVEGSGVITERSMRFASIGVWLDAPAVARKRRALARDGEAYVPHWERWAAQEDAHILRDQPAARATLTFDVS
nr:hypothetical protein [Microbacterium endophyticum]